MRGVASVKPVSSLSPMERLCAVPSATQFTGSGETVTSTFSSWLRYSVRPCTKPVVYEKEFDPNAYYDNPEDPFTVSAGENEGEFLIEGPRIEKMLGYTNLESEKGFMFFQNFMKENGILEELERLGIEDGDTVKIYGHEFEYYK